jgi:hypothetical protein
VVAIDNDSGLRPVIEFIGAGREFRKGKKSGASDGAKNVLFAFSNVEKKGRIRQQ